jgi:hypothetical protein
LHYDPEQGIFYHKLTHGRAKAGDAAGCVHIDGYLRIQVKKRSYAAHRLVWLWETGAWPKRHIDHIDGNKINNRISNLRDVNQSVNMQNLKKASAVNKTGFLGVWFEKGPQKYRAAIRLNGKRLYLGYYATPEEASAAYFKAKKNLHEGYVF